MNNSHMLIMLLTGVVSFAVAAALGKVAIPWLHKLKFGQTILDEGPSWHQKKQGTPTMGGVLFISSFVAAALIAALLLWVTDAPHVFGTPYETARFWGGIGLAVGCGLIGFVDDYIKVVKKRNLGLTAVQKLLLQLLLSAAYAILLFIYNGGRFSIPFFGEVNWGVWYVPFAVFVIVAMTNATNLTDGVDGLCGTTGFVAALALLLLSGLAGLLTQGVLAVALAGGLAGFLLWNLHPAKVFMGDTGSLFIGGALTALAFGLEQPFMLVPIGILYIAENMSVILQVGYFKLTHGKRLFKMSPLHHHFELCGWSENKIVLVFSAVTLVGGAAAVLLWLYAG
ncbi:MAG: phospho-N-acetylmuramoyl-pentapeptide-transferase [Clostridia bacterium]|nr:phospho-N-acetylmuramoyl-pentapeptide-transferase [Clostridia bacterium]